MGIALALAAEGANVAVASRSRERIEAAAREVGGRGYVHDSNDLDSASALVDSVEADIGPLDILVTNTGGPPPGADPLGFTRAQWEAAYRTLPRSRPLPERSRRSQPAAYVTGAAVSVDGGLTHSV